MARIAGTRSCVVAYPAHRKRDAGPNREGRPIAPRPSRTFEEPLQVLGLPGVLHVVVDDADEAHAQRHCPQDKVVWLDFRKGVYYRKGQRRYGQGFDGSFVCQNEARGSFYRRSLLGLR